MNAELQKGVSFRAVLRDLQASRTGQLTFDFRIDAQPARIIALKPREALTPAPSRLTPDRGIGPLPSRPLTTAEQYFLMGSLLDDGTPERQEEAAQAYRRALEDDPDLVAAIINLANIRYAKDELAEAQALYERAILLDPTLLRGALQSRQHPSRSRHATWTPKPVTAKRLALNADYPDAHFYLAVTLEKMGRSADAQPHWQAYQRLAPEGRVGGARARVLRLTRFATRLAALARGCRFAARCARGCGFALAALAL